MLPNLFVTKCVWDLHLRLKVRGTSIVYRRGVRAPLEQVTSLKKYCKFYGSCTLQRRVSFTVVCPLFAICLSVDARCIGLSGMACRSIDGRCAFYFWSLVKATANGTSDWERIDEVYASGGSYSHETSIWFFIFCLDSMKNVWHIDKLHQLKK